MKRDGRLHIRIPEDLRRWVLEYVKEQHTTVSDLLIRFLVRIKNEEEKRKNPEDGEQI